MGWRVLDYGDGRCGVGGEPGCHHVWCRAVRSLGRSGGCCGYPFRRCRTPGSIPEVIGLTGRRSDAVECRILQGRDVRSVRVLVPDPRGLDQHFHDVTIVDMGDVPESAVSIPELSLLRQQWPPAVLSHMVWLQ